MMLNSRFELSKIERKNESFSIKLSKIESRKRIFSFHSRKSRVEREFFLSTLENREWKENFLLPLSKIESRKRNGKYQIFEIEREISLSTLDFSLESETLVNAWDRFLNFFFQHLFWKREIYNKRRMHNREKGIFTKWISLPSSGSINLNSCLWNVKHWILGWCPCFASSWSLCQSLEPWGHVLRPSGRDIGLSWPSQVPGGRPST